MDTPRVAGLIAVIGFVLLILSAFFGSAHLHVPNLDDWLINAAEFSFVLAVGLFFGWFFVGFIKEVRDVA